MRAGGKKHENMHEEMRNSAGEPGAAVLIGTIISKHHLKPGTEQRNCRSVLSCGFFSCLPFTVHGHWHNFFRKSLYSLHLLSFLWKQAQSERPHEVWAGGKACVTYSSSSESQHQSGETKSTSQMPPLGQGIVQQVVRTHKAQHSTPQPLQLQIRLIGSTMQWQPHLVFKKPVTPLSITLQWTRWFALKHTLFLQAPAWGAEVGALPALSLFLLWRKSGALSCDCLGAFPGSPGKILPAHSINQHISKFWPNHAMRPDKQKQESACFPSLQ